MKPDNFALMKYSFPVLLICGLMFSSILIFLNLGSGSIDLWDEAITGGRSLAYITLTAL